MHFNEQEWYRVVTLSAAKGLSQRAERMLRFAQHDISGVGW